MVNTFTVIISVLVARIISLLSSVSFFMYVLIPNIMADYNDIIIVINQIHSVLCCGFFKATIYIRNISEV